MNIEIKEVEETRVVFIRYKGLPQKASKYLSTLFKSIKGKSCGAPIFYYLKEITNSEEVEMEICVPSDENPNIAGVEVKILPRERVIATTYVGPYTNLSKGYEELMTYVKENQVNVTGVAKEIYLKGPGMILPGNPSKYITEIQFLLG